MSQAETLAVRCATGCKRAIVGSTEAELLTLLSASGWSMLQITPNRYRCGQCSLFLVAVKDISNDQPPPPDDPLLFQQAALMLTKVAGSSEPVTNDDVKKWNAQ